MERTGALVAAPAAPLLKRLRTPITDTRVPGDTLSTRLRLTLSSVLRGISPVGTTSGASWSLKFCWSTYSHWSGTMTYEFGPQSFCPSTGRFPPMSQLAGRAAPEKPLEHAMAFFVPHLVQRQTMVTALDWMRDALMTMPGTLISLFTWSAFMLRSCCGTWSLFTSTWKSGSTSPSGKSTMSPASASFAARSKRGRYSEGRSAIFDMRSWLYSCRCAKFTSRNVSRLRHRCCSCSRYG